MPWTLAREYGTPLYVLDEQLHPRHVPGVRDGDVRNVPEGQILYAGKALLTAGMCRIIEEEGMGLDVVSGGELYTAMTAGLPVERIYFHGNNKSDDELALAVDAGVGRIVVDNVGDLTGSKRLARSARRALRCVAAHYPRRRSRHPLLRPNRSTRFQIRHAYR